LGAPENKRIGLIDRRDDMSRVKKNKRIEHQIAGTRTELGGEERKVKKRKNVNTGEGGGKLPYRVPLEINERLRSAKLGSERKHRPIPKAVEVERKSLQAHHGRIAKA